MHNRPVLEHVLLIILGALWQEEVTQNLRESIGVDEQRKVSTCGKRQRTNDTIEIMYHQYQAWRSCMEDWVLGRKSSTAAV